MTSSSSVTERSGSAANRSASCRRPCVRRASTISSALEAKCAYIAPLLTPAAAAISATRVPSYPRSANTSAAARSSRSRVSVAVTPAIRPMPELNERSSDSSRVSRGRRMSRAGRPASEGRNGRSIIGVQTKEARPMTVLRSYTGGQWRAPSGEGAPLHDAVTGEEVARISSDGIDKAAALEYGRAVGGPALRELTFHQRAALLKSLSSYLREHREELYTLSARTGATLNDSKFDVDGRIGLLAR